MEKGADKDKASNIGRTPLDVAHANGHAKVAAYLRAAGEVKARSPQVAAEPDVPEDSDSDDSDLPSLEFLEPLG